MKKLISMICIALLVLSGCFYSDPEHSKKEFCYLQQNYLHSSARTILSSEKRSIEGSPEMIIRSYLSGPKSVNLISPFPEGTELCSLTLTEGCIEIDLGDAFASVTDMNLTIASGALAQTCFHVFKVNTVIIKAGSSLLNGKEQLTIRTDSIMLNDSCTGEVTR